MSRNSDAKKARRKKRQAGRDARWAPVPDEFDEIRRAVSDVNEWIVGRGWLPDDENVGDELLSWVYPPSAAEFDDEAREPVTRIWIGLDEDGEDLLLEFGAALVGSGPHADEGLYLLEPETLAVDIVALEAYRHGQPLPVLA